MLGHRDLTLEDYTEILKRRAWLIVIAAASVLVIAVGTSYVLPPEFLSRALVIIQQQKVPYDYVRPVVNDDLGARMATMREQILSRSRLEPIIDRFKLFAGNGKTMDDRVELTRKAVSIEPINGAQSHGMPGFFITFKAPEAHTAQQVCSEITSLFVSENVSSREQSAEGTTSFLKQQLADAKQKLDEQDGALAAFQQKYLGQLPEQQGANMGTLQAVTTQLDAATQALNRMQQDETFLETVIAEQTADSQRAEPSTGATVSTLQSQLQALITQKADLETRYTHDYPDVVAVTREIAELQEKIKHSETPHAAVSASSSGNRPDPPQLAQSKAQLRALRQAVTNKKHDQAALEAQVRTFESRVEARPQVEAELKQITRDHDVASTNYNRLLKELGDSNMATSLEQNQQGEQFQVLDPPNLPDEPTFPNRFVFAGGGCIGGIFLGLAIAALLEYRDKSLRNERDVWAFTKLPTLAIISHIDELGSRSKNKRRWFIFPAKKASEGRAG